MLGEYPAVHGEIETINAVLNGASLSRFGDGELKIMDGRGYSREAPNKALAEELRQIIKGPSKRCIVGIPTMDPKGEKYNNWLRHKARFCKYLAGIEYYSSLVTRPDCGAWMESKEYVELVQRIWEGKSVTVISEPASKLLEAVKKTAEVTHIECPTNSAYSQIRRLEKKAIKAGNSIVIISCGPTATCLANRFAGNGIQGVDLGSIGGLLMRYL